ncbi:DoxX-like family protein [Gordonia sp. CPCC 205333]|uniref:DoxX-like family protein n=1 Tax=Gordonia sp. CPCC 205333 TaxID=3140790 RepID=UPI003AF3D9E5
MNSGLKSRMRRRKPIYVESLIRTSMDALWDATQDPKRHSRWDLRFGEIEYLAKVDGEPQQFRYATTVIPGFTVAGTGETLGDRDRPDGTRWSGLKFWADDPRSIIKSGAGYWRYVPTDGGIRFLTRYDYRPRWGPIGEWLDKVAFRPLFGWGTAWSFDRLRLWLEEGIPPATSRNTALAHATATGSLAAIWMYQGLIPKLIFADEDERIFWLRRGYSNRAAAAVVRVIGVGELAFGGAVAGWSDRKWPFVITAASMPLLAAGAFGTERKLFARAFNPATLNIASAGLALVALATHEGRPSGRTPLRDMPDRQPDVGDLP